MLFSILIPSFKNFDYLKLTINSIRLNSKFKHEIIVHINGIDKSAEEFLLKNKIKYTQTSKNIGLCKSVNTAHTLSTHNYIVFAHDDMYFLPNWDLFLIKEIKSLKNNKFFLSSTQISSNLSLKKTTTNHIYFDAGNKISNFKVKYLLRKFKRLKFYNLQGSHWAPHVIHKDIWNKVKGFSEEFDPGFGSDPDLNMKLWKEGVRIFKGVDKSRVYHFGSLTTRKNKKIIRNNANKTFLLKWGISINFFTVYFLRRGGEYTSPLKNFSFTFSSFCKFIICKIKLAFIILEKNFN